MIYFYTVLKQESSAWRCPSFINGNVVQKIVATMPDEVRSRTPVFGLVGIRMVIIGIRLQTLMRVIVGVDVYVRLSPEI